jgi:predicted Fe-Mo cluster-binding NifX family protein
MLRIVKARPAGRGRERRSTMRICIPTDGVEGLGAEVAHHLGRAPFLTLVDTDSGAFDVIANAARRGGQCQPAAPLAGRGVDAVVCPGLGRRALAMLEAAGIRVLATRASRVGDVLESLRAGAAREMSTAEACGGHRDLSGCRDGR